MSWFKNLQLDKTIPGLLLFSVGLILAVTLAVYLIKDLTIWVFGETVVGEVVQMEYVEMGKNSQGEPFFEYSVVYEFTASNGRVLIGTSPVSAGEWGSLAEGAPVLVGYFPLYPAHNRLDDSQFVFIYLAGYAVVLILSIAALAAGASMLRIGRGGRRGPFWTETLRRQDQGS